MNLCHEKQNWNKRMCRLVVDSFDFGTKELDFILKVKWHWEKTVLIAAVRVSFIRKGNMIRGRGEILPIIIRAKFVKKGKRGLRFCCNRIPKALQSAEWTLRFTLMRPVPTERVYHRIWGGGWWNSPLALPTPMPQPHWALRDQLWRAVLRLNDRQKHDGRVETNVL